MSWKTGQSGNPRGRPRHSIAERFRQAVDPRLDEVIDAVIQAALGGDVAACKLLLERVVPPFRAAQQPTPFAMEGNSLTEKAQAVLAAVAGGTLPAADGVALVNALAALGRLVEIDDLERRIAALEEVKHARP